MDGALHMDAIWRRGDFVLEAAFSCPAGVTGIFGQSGAGKTSIAHLIAGLARPDSGRITLGDDLLFDAAAGTFVPPEARRIGYVFQDARLFPHMRVRANLEYGLRRSPLNERTAEFDEVVTLLGLEELLDRNSGGLSGGEKQRVAIGRALLMSPRLLIMDEPLANLDAARRAEILPFLEALKEELGLSIVYITHNMGELVRLSDHSVLVDSGQIVAEGPVEDVFSRFELRDLIDTADGGTVLAARIAGHDEDTGLTTLDTGAGPLYVPYPGLDRGHDVHVRIRARDVALATEKPNNISVLNVFPATVAAVEDMSEAQADVSLVLDANGDAEGAAHPLWARITRRSRAELGIGPGTRVYALIKAVAVERG